MKRKCAVCKKSFDHFGWKLGNAQNTRSKYAVIPKDTCFDDIDCMIKFLNKKLHRQILYREEMLK
ncbi:MAG TPA: hypothetical protein VJ044_19515 [Candidatus Hodarchaeales archaeon]|nr:hypothetical protein [Candidatus Hodarchaeales archaeon]